MCTKKPGPRCSSHTRQAYAQATAEFKADPTSENKATLDRAKAAYYTSPEGIKRLRDAGKHEAASRMQGRRERMTERLKAVEAFDNSDPRTQQRVVTHSVHESARATGLEVESLDWSRNSETGLIDVDVQLGYDENPWEMDYGYLGDIDGDGYSSVLSLNDFSDSRTVDADLAAYADRANEALDSASDVGLGNWEERPFVDYASNEEFDYSEAIGSVRVHKPGPRYDSDSVKDHYRKVLERQAENSTDVDDLRAIIAHPLATDEIRGAARSNVQILED